jgi:molybdopterin/thiamine biosynthesis adenylyltransferase
MNKRARRLTDWQRFCLSQIKASAHQMPDALRVVGNGTLDDETQMLHIPFTLDTSEIESVPTGLQLQDREPFVIAIRADEEHPPAVYVQHFRFLGYPHVLSGFLLCLYLDETREWDPRQGLNGGPNAVLNRLWRWLEDAAKARFNADTALYHAVGGLPHLSRDGFPLPPIVVRDLPPQHGRAASAWLTRRSDWCLQLHPSRPSDVHAEHIPVFFTDRDLPFGAGSDYLYELTTRLERFQHKELAKLGARTLPAVWDVLPPGLAECKLPTSAPTDTYRPVAKLPNTSQAVALLTALAASASRKPHGTPQTALLAVPHPTGGPRHLIAVFLVAQLADHLRRLIRDKQSGPISFDQAQLDRATPLRWCFISDEREEVTTRRDRRTPVAAYRDARVLVWGVGGLGSWIAEFIVRAGASSLTVCDTGIVTGGLLVRQDYVDNDIGGGKADRLAERLRVIAPGAEIVSCDNVDDESLRAFARSADLIIDATINRAVGRRLEAAATDSCRTAVIAQVATDAGSGSLGLTMVHGPASCVSMGEIDAQVGCAVDEAPSLEPYRVFWRDPAPGDEFVPTRGCSVPTFHGSAADLAAVAASLTSLIAPHLTDGASGTHLMALPQSGIAPAHCYIPHGDSTDGTAA